LRRAIQRLIEDPLAERLLMGDFKAGDTIYIDAQNGETVFTTEPPTEVLGGIEAAAVASAPDGEAGVTEPSEEDRERLSKMMED
jgi:hypothetical protein